MIRAGSRHCCATTCSRPRSRWRRTFPTLAAGLAGGALAGLVSGSGPTCAFLAADAEHARELAGKIATTEHCRYAVAVAGGVPGPSGT